MADLICPECEYKNEPDSRYCDDCGALLRVEEKKEEKAQEILAPRIGDLIGERYLIKKMLSTSDTCSIYLATDKENNDEEIWIKEKLETDENEGDFIRQEKLFNLLMENAHENIAEILDDFREEKKYYIVQEKLEGKDLQTLLDLKGEEFDEFHIETIAIQALEGLKFLHSLNIMHRDIQPSHLFLTSDGMVKLIGFGRISILNNPPLDNRVTEGFSPPEAFGLVGGKVNASSDIFSLGVTLYYLLTGSQPRQFSRENSFHFRSFGELDKKINEDFEEIILKAINKNPHNRFQSPEEMLDALLLMDSDAVMEKKETAREGEKLELDIYAQSHVGMVRSINQDSCFVGTNSAYEKSDPLEYTLLIVADGMGGEAEGDKASSLAIRVIANEVLGGFIPINTGPDTIRLYDKKNLQEKASYILKRSIEKANKVVFDYSREDVARRGMGSTLTSALIEKDNMCICHAGDTRAYVYNSEEGLIQLTEDHSLVGRLVRMGQLTRDEALKSPQRSAIYRALGTSPELEVDIYQRILKKGDTLLFCSDGVWEYYTDNEMTEIISKAATPRILGNTLIKKCLDRGADDNATLIAVKVLGDYKEEEGERLEEPEEIQEPEATEKIEETKEEAKEEKPVVEPEVRKVEEKEEAGEETEEKTEEEKEKVESETLETPKEKEEKTAATDEEEIKKETGKKAKKKKEKIEETEEEAEEASEVKEAEKAGEGEAEAETKEEVEASEEKNKEEAVEEPVIKEESGKKVSGKTAAREEETVEKKEEKQ